MQNLIRMFVRIHYTNICLSLGSNSQPITLCSGSLTTKLSHRQYIKTSIKIPTDIQATSYSFCLMPLLSDQTLSDVFDCGSKSLIIACRLYTRSISHMNSKETVSLSRKQRYVLYIQYQPAILGIRITTVCHCVMTQVYLIFKLRDVLHTRVMQLYASCINWVL